MSKGQLLTIALATAIGIGNGLYVFQPYLREQQQEREEKQAAGATLLNDHLTPKLAARNTASAQTSLDQPQEPLFNEPAAPAPTVWQSIRDFGARTFEPGDQLRRKWAKENEKSENEPSSG